MLEKPTALRPLGKGLALFTLRYATEVRPSDPSLLLARASPWRPPDPPHRHLVLGRRRARNVRGGTCPGRAAFSCRLFLLIALHKLSEFRDRDCEFVEALAVLALDPFYLKQLPTERRDLGHQFPQHLPIFKRCTTVMWQRRRIRRIPVSRVRGGTSTHSTRSR